MAKTNYNKISNTPKEVVETVVETPEVVEEATAVDETVAEETVVETPAPEKKRKGVVVNCGKLNVRKAPNLNAEILGTINAGSSVTIYGEEGDFYNIGPTQEYCMKKYISVK